MPELLEVMQGWESYTSVRGKPADEGAIAEAIDLLLNKRGYTARMHAAILEEAITTTDFPYLFGQILDRQVLARYKMALPDWQSYFKMGTRKDFNQARLHKVQGNDGLLPEVPEKGEYLVAPMNESRYTIQVSKRGRQFDISWEAVINDDLGAFSDMPNRFADAAIYTEAYLATSTYSSAAGPNAALFGTPIADVDGQNVTNLGTLPLTIANLETTLELMAAQTDVNGRPISVRGVHVVVPPALEFTARAILTSALKQWTEVGAGAGIPVPTTNVIPQYGLKLHVDPLLPVIDASGNVDTTWYVFAEPSQIPAMEFDRLRGHETPEICMKASDKVSVTGAPLSPLSGDFATDNVFYRVRIVCGTAQLDPRAAYSQNGTA